MNTTERYDKYVLGNYAKAPLTLVRGQGSYVWDEAGRRYLDFTSGIAVNALGHNHPAWVERVQAQAAVMTHASNLFRHEPQGLLAERLVAAAGPGKVLFCNSGAEANEALLKLARLHGQKKAGREGAAYKVIGAQRGFHGRTFGAMSATPQEKIQGGFRPLLDGFAFGELNDVDSFAALIDEQTAAIFVETVQGEGGVYPAEAPFLQGLRKLCDEHDLLLLIDEVQCGIGRTGAFFAYEHAGIRPDAIGMAKGLGGGFPIGAIWVADDHADLFTPGSHGTTFGGGPLACAAALATLDVLRDEDLIAHVHTASARFREGLEALVTAFPDQLTGVRGMGFMLALALKDEPTAMMTALREEGLLVARGGTDAVRFLPPLNASEVELDEALAIVRAVLTATPAPAVTS